MMKPKVAVLYGFGINCDHETKAVFDLVGGDAERVHVNHFVNGTRDLSEFQIMAVPGGFSFGDHLGSGRLLGNRMRFALRDMLNQFVADGKPIIGICNGFQVLVKTGLLPGPEAQQPDFVQRASLTLNNSGKYEDRWVTLDFNPESNCIWTKGLTRIDCPVRHGEGKFVMPSQEDLDRLSANGQIVTKYVDPATEEGEGFQDELLPFPISPNGSARNIAGITDSTGLIFGLMPHPEAIYAKWLHPDHTRYTAPDAPDCAPEPEERTLGDWEGEGLQIFRNAVEFVKSKS